MSTPPPASSLSISTPPSQEQRPLASWPVRWPVQLCIKCTSMTATPEGILELLSPDGYEHYDTDELKRSAEKGCLLCALISNVISAGFYGYKEASDGVGISLQSLIEVEESVGTVLISAVEGDEISLQGHEADKSEHIEHLSFLSVTKMKRLSVGYISKRGSRYIGLDAQPVSFIKISAFTDPESPRFSNPLILAENLKFEQQLQSVAVTGAVVDERIQRCFNECIKSHHSTCPSNLNPILPRRVVDVESDKGPEKLSLHLTNSGERAKYVALSYCWGDPPHPFVTTRNTLENPTKIDWGQTPATIRDAVLVTRSLGIRYLWVDALCIIQGDEIDKTEEIREMGMIYKNATLTISAASSPNVNSGFLKDRPVTNFPMPIVSPDGDYGTLWIRGPNLTPHDEPLDKRGWTLQEAMLSPRMLYYSSKDLIWKCQKTTFKPVVPDHDLYSVLPGMVPILPSTVFNIPSQKKIDISDFWAMIQTSYSNRHLQLFEDRFRAIGGIAEELQRVSNDIYIAGLWKNSIVKDLAWARTKGDWKNGGGLLPYQSPSWSWLAYFRPVHTQYIDRDTVDDMRPELISWSVNFADKASPFGHILGGELEMMATLVESTKVPHDIVTNMKLILDCDVSDTTATLASNFVSDDYYYFYLGQQGEEEIWWEAILLQSVGNGSFVRRGLVSMLDKGTSLSIWLSKDSLRMRVRIV